MEVVVLPPQDALKRHHHPHNNHQQRRLISPNKPRRNPNPNPNSNPNAAVQTARSNRRRRSSNSPPPPRPASPTLAGPIRILKRGEGLPQPETKPAPVKPVVAGPIGPMFINGFYAGSACVTSPAPSELPVPAFFSRSCGLSAVAVEDNKHQKIADDLRHMLKLF